MILVALFVAGAGVTVSRVLSDGPASERSEKWESDSSARGVLISPSLAYVIVSRNGADHLHLVDPGLDRWQEVTPPLRQQRIYDVFFLDSETGWVAVGNCTTAKWGAYRTRDGGQSWTPISSTSVNCAAGSGIEHLFLDANRGFRSSYLGNGNEGSLVRTDDGGRSWAVVADHLGNGRSVRGHVFFQNRLRGWHRDINDTGALHETSDGGRTWRRVRLRPPPRLGRVSAVLEQPSVIYALPAVFGQRGVLSVTYATEPRAVVLYTSADSGRSWRVAATHTLPGGCSPRADPVSARTWWLASCGNSPAIRVTTNGGKRWRTTALPVRPVRILSISALDDRRAWVVLERSPGSVSRLYSTIDGGQTWRPIEPPKP